MQLVVLVTLASLPRRATRKRRRRHARAGVVLTALIASDALAICVAADAPARLTVGVIVTLAAVGTCVSLLAFVAQSDTRWPLVQLTSGLLCAACFGMFLIVEGALRRVLVGDELTTLLGLAGGGISLLLQATVTRFQWDDRAPRRSARTRSRGRAHPRRRRRSRRGVDVDR